ncbi:MAG: T9SS type A sorting domain-containing protein [Bacteroidales bacterium]|nr:T9SS type A sorting domain-containing protein [Bacteroidales bacterium]
MNMKRIFSLAIAFLMLMSAQSKTIEKTYFFQDFQLEQKGEYTKIIAQGAFNTAIIGQPLLPWYATKMLLPAGEEIESVEFIGSHLIKISGNYQLLPQQYSQPISKGSSGIFTKDKSLYKSNENYPINNFQEGSTSYLAGHSIGFVNYTPFVYQPQSGQLSYYEQVTIVIHTTPSAKATEAMQLLSSQKNIQNKVLSLIENPDALKSYPNIFSKTDDYDIMIITPDQFIADFDTLIGHYLIRGLKTQLKSKEEILAEISGQDAPEKIRNYIIQEFADHGVSYVLLGGDVEHMPYRGFYCRVQSSSVYEDSNIPSDLYFSALDGNWNTDGDGKWGEIGEDDLLPEIAVARFSFSNSSELSKMIHKTISYQTTPVLGNLAHPLMVGEHLYDYPLTWGSQYLELLIGYHDDNSYETTGIPETNTFTKLYEVNSNWSSSQLMNEINSGKSFLHHVGHANTDYVMKFSNGDITNANFAAANGIDQMFTNVYTHGCICGSFDSNDCIAEYMVKIDNFAAAFVGNSRYGWFNEGQTEGPSAHIHREFIDALYTDSLHRIGATHMESKYATAPWVNAPGQHEEGALRWCFYDCNVLGDPAMSIWTAEPWDIEVSFPSAITIGQNNYSLDISSAGEAVEGLNASLVFNGELYGTTTSDMNGNCSLVIDPFTEVGTATLWVSGFNCTPHPYIVEVIPSEGAYIILNACEINDESGNNNGMIDYGETILLNISLENVGAVIATEVNAHLSCENDDITIIVADADFGDIGGNSTLTLDAAFNFSVSESIENMSQVVFNLNMTSGSDSWEAQFTLVALAPELSLISFDLNDAAGNNNGRLDPGETAQFMVSFINEGGSTSPLVQAVLTTDSDLISISNPNQNTDPLEPEQQTNLNFELSVDQGAEIGDIVQLMMNLNAGEYAAFMSYFLAIGLQVEDWESGDFDQYDWYSGGNAGWNMTSNNTYEGEYCAQSGMIGDNQRSEMNIDLNIINHDSISFYYQVSSEDNFDYLRFSIDENEQDKWSGEESWTRAVYAVQPGEHTFSWAYTKDVLVSSGQDKAWVDYIVFPAMGMISQTQTTWSKIDMLFYPNPVAKTAYLTFTNEKDQIVQIQVIDQNGKIIYQNDQQFFTQGKQLVDIDLTYLSSGAYTLLLKSKTTSSVVNFIKY